jgi:A/G-specific adenine glycosylase
VGPSTAAAISSFVNLERVAIMDSNVYRVIARFYCLRDLGSESKNRKKALELALQLLPKDPEYMPLYSQYIMDLGALICTTKNPSCDVCPVSNSCDAKALDIVDKFPVRVQKKWKEKILDWILLITENKILLERQLKESLWHSLFVPATKESLISPQTSSERLFIKSYRVNVSNCKLTINVWKENLNSNNFRLKKNQIMLHVTNVRKVPLPKVLVKILEDLSLS